MTFDATKPFNALPELPPVLDVKAERIQAGLTAARQALQRLNAVSRVVLAAEDFYSALLYEETTSHDALATNASAAALAWAMRFAQDDAKVCSAARYRSALVCGCAYVRANSKISVELLLELHRLLCAHPYSGIRDGKVRVSDGRRLIFTAPVGRDRLMQLLRNLEDYINNDPTDALVKLGVILHQFIWIHPFCDGNGRVGRLLMVLYLLHAQAIDEPVLFLNCYFKAHFEQYLHVLNTTLLTQNWENLLCFMLSAVEKTAEATIQKAVPLGSGGCH